MNIIPSDQWREKYDRGKPKVEQKYLARSVSADSRQHYDLSYIVDADIQMFRATSDNKYLDSSLEYVFNVIDSSVQSTTLPNSQYKDGFLSWPSLSSKTAIHGREYPLFESYFWRYGAVVLKAMKEKKLDVDTEYKERFQRVLYFVEKHVLEKWLARGYLNIYRSRTHMACHWAYIALVLAQCSDGKVKLVAQEIVDNINFKGIPVGSYYGASLVEQFYPSPISPDGVSWYKDWIKDPNFSGQVQDVSHGNGVVSYLVEAADSGVFWNAKQLQKIIIPTKKSLLIEPFAREVDGAGVGTGWVVDGFVKLGRYDLELQKILENHTGAGTEGPSYLASMALNAKQLLQ